MQICALFNECDAVLGPVGAAKALHLLAPKFFPLWDREIAKWYKCPLVGVGSNGERYWRFMKIAQEQCIDLKNQGENVLKLIDEYNYVTFSRKLLVQPAPR